LSQPYRHTTMKNYLALPLSALALVLLGGCGGDAGVDVAGDPAGSPSAAPSASPTAAEDPVMLTHPTGADEVVLWIETGGGFVPVEYAFTNQPTFLLSGDGRLFRQGEVSEQTRLIPMTVTTLDEAQVQEVLRLAEDAGLLGAPPDYTDTSGGPQISDAPTTSVIVTAEGQTWQHDAYALGFDEEQAERAALGDFIVAVTALVDGLDSDDFAPTELAAYVMATDLDRDVQAWPADEVSLADIDGCQVVPAQGLVDALSQASLTTMFRQDGAVYSVSAAAVLPGDQPCS
jgi:hypothetical protein